MGDKTNLNIVTLTRTQSIILRSVLEFTIPPLFSLVHLPLLRKSPLEALEAADPALVHGGHGLSLAGGGGPGAQGGQPGLELGRWSRGRAQYL